MICCCRAGLRADFTAIRIDMSVDATMEEGASSLSLSSVVKEIQVFKDKFKREDFESRKSTDPAFKNSTRSLAFC